MKNETAYIYGLNFPTAATMWERDKKRREELIRAELVSILSLMEKSTTGSIQIPIPYPETIVALLKIGYIINPLGNGQKEISWNICEEEDRYEK